MQREFHPDRFADKPERDKLRAVQWAATVNQAFDTLKSPLKRAQYLIGLQGLDSSGESTVTSDPEFLMEQMALREALADLRDQQEPFAALDELRDRARQAYGKLQEAFAVHYGSANYDVALDTVAKMQFFAKLLDEIEILEADLEEGY